MPPSTLAPLLHLRHLCQVRLFKTQLDSQGVTPARVKTLTLAQIRQRVIQTKDPIMRKDVAGNPKLYMQPKLSE